MRIMRTAIAIILAVCTASTEAMGQSSSGKQIKTETIMQYNVVAGQREPEGTRISLRRLDEEGRTVEQTSYKPDGTVIQKSTFAYDSRGNLQETVTTSLVEDASQRITCSYDDNNFLVESSVYTLDGRPKMRMTYSYQKGRLTEMITYTRDNRVSIRVVNMYGDDGRIVEAFGMTETGDVLSRVGYEYDSEGLQTTRIGKDGDIVLKTTKLFDPDGKLREETSYDQDNRMTSQTRNRYDDNGRLIEVIAQVPSANMRTRKTITYDDNGNSVEQTTYNKLDEPVQVLRSVYEYYE